jgi:poly-beta-1,6-N-acetyl-D-glucosamine synthase
MWLLVFIFLFITGFIGWMLFGYFILIFLIGIFTAKKAITIPAELPDISVVVSCYNEEAGILDKVKNLRQLEYPQECLQIVFVDGGSTDNTVPLLEKEQGGDLPITILASPTKGKISQINYALPKLRGKIIVNTDVDARLKPDALLWIAAEFAADPNVWVVGAYCYPEQTLAVEKYYWSAQNKSRFLESDANSSSIVIAQCYAFRRELMSSFLEDVVADDIYVAFLASVMGKKTVYSRKAIASETRNPQSYAEFMPHKFRKSNAFLRESLRFIYRLPEMNALFKATLLTRIAQQTLLPWALLSWLLVSGVLLTLFRYDIVIFGTAFLAFFFVVTQRIFSWQKLPGEPQSYSLLTTITGYVLTLVIMLATALSYPFYRQGSSYARLGNSPAGVDVGNRAP